MKNRRIEFPPPPPRGFTESEFVKRTERAQEAMAVQKIDALLLTTEPNVRYFSGFLSQFWESPTRPWFLVVPFEGKPIAVVPEIGASGFAGTWIDDIRSWPAPQPADDGISLLTDLLSRLTRRHGTLGITMGHESHLRMPLGDYNALIEALPGVEVIDSTNIIRNLRAIKSESEVEKIAYACEVAGNAFAALPDHATTGLSEREIVRQFRIDLLSGGCDSAPYVIAGSGPGGYDSIIMGPTDRVLGSGDTLIIDTGATFDGYFCDFDRNFAFDYADDLTCQAYEVCWQATEAGLKAARPGASAEDLCLAMAKVLSEGGALGNDVGRLGHGLGMQLTEWPSNKEGDLTLLKPGMVMTLEPGMLFAPGRMMVHEENILITDDAPRLLTRRATPELPVIK